MKKKYGFIKFDNIKEFSNWLDKQPKYGYTGIQGHHMFAPCYDQWPEDPLVRQKNIKDFHINTNKWGDIAQHFSTFPDGCIVTGRDLSKTTAIGIKGWNTKKICIENYGNFDKGKDTMTPKQKQTIVAIYALLCLHEGITPSANTIRYHCWFDANGNYLGDYNKYKSAKTCPGTNFFGGNTKAKMKSNFLPLIRDYIKNVNKEVIENKKVYNKDVKVVCNDCLNVRDSRPINGQLGKVKFTLDKEAIVKLGYVLDNWGSIYTDDNWGYVNIKYLELV